MCRYDSILSIVTGLVLNCILVDLLSSMHQRATMFASFQQQRAIKTRFTKSRHIKEKTEFFATKSKAFEKVELLGASAHKSEVRRQIWFNSIKPWFKWCALSAFSLISTYQVSEIGWNDQIGKKLVNYICYFMNRQGHF